jgi:Fungal fucose-specific lectin
VLVVESGGPGESHPRELWWDSNGWHHNDLTGDISTAPLSLVQAPCAFVFDADGTQHVDYVASDRQINEFWWQSGDWHHNNLGAAANAPPAAEASPVGYAFVGQSTLHVDYVGMDGHIHELWWETGDWNHNDLTAATDSPLPDVSGLAAYAFEGDGTQHVDYVGPDHHVHELWWNADGWHHNDLTAASNAPVMRWSVVCGYAFEAQRTQHVVCAEDDGSMHELWWASDSWHYSDLTAETRAPAAALATPGGYVFAATSD